MISDDEPATAEPPPEPPPSPAVGESDTAPLLDADARSILLAEEASIEQRREHDVAALHRLLAWCDLHSVDPQTQPGAVPISRGGDRLISLGGEGCPQVAELCLAEFAIAAHAGTIATQNRAADYLDLRHRLPLLHEAVGALILDLWVARRVASMSRRLPVDRIHVVDRKVARAVHESPSRILAIAEAAVIEADPEAHRRLIAEDAARVGVFSKRPRTGDRVGEIPESAEPEARATTLRLSGADTEALLDTIEQVTDALEAEANAAAALVDSPDDAADSGAVDAPTRDQLRAQAAALLADPAAVLRLLGGPDAEPEEPPVKPRRRPAHLVVHVDSRVLAGQRDGVCRAEQLGPLLLEQVQALFVGRSITVQPVIDLAEHRAVSAYEHPVDVRRRTELRTARDVFPHSGRLGISRVDHDHPTPYRPPGSGGPPDQTGDHNDAPLARRDHRAKTHLGFRAEQLGDGTYAWATPNGLGRLVTPGGTRRVEFLGGPDDGLADFLVESWFGVVLDLERA